LISGGSFVDEVSVHSDDIIVEVFLSTPEYWPSKLHGGVSGPKMRSLGSQQKADDMTDKATIGTVDLAAITAAALAGVERAMAAHAIDPKRKWPGSILTGIVLFPSGPDMPETLAPWQSKQSSPIALTAHDHTIIIEAIFKEALPLLAELGVIRDRSRRVTPDELLAALRKVTTDEEVGDAVDRAITVRKTFAGAEDQIDQDSKARIAKLAAQLDEAGTVDAKIGVLQSAIAKSSGRNEAYTIGLQIGITILEDGRATIYNPDFYVTVLGPSVGGEIARSTAGGIAQSDVTTGVGTAVGAAAVGVVAPLAEPAIIALGALGGAIAGSATKALDALIDWLF
jgi:hypothetical protein